jgi:protein gp37
MNFTRIHHSPGQDTALEWFEANEKGTVHKQTIESKEDEWIRSLRDQCIAYDVKFMWKQDATPNGRKISLPLLDGRQWTEMPDREGAHA